MTEQNKARSLKYLGIELLQKDANKSSTPKVGLFRGIKTRSSQVNGQNKVIRLILTGLKGKENDLIGYNAEVYNILSIKMMYSDTKELIVFKATDEDQKLAMAMLEACLEEFKEEKRMVDNDPEIIDTVTFKEVPKEFSDSDTTSSFAGSGKAVGAGTNYNYNNGYYNNNQEWQKKEAERKKEKERQEKLRWTPTLIKRESDLPTLKVLNAMRKKVAAIAKGELEVQLEDPDKTPPDEKKSSQKSK